VSAFRIVPAHLQAPVLASAVAGELLSAAAIAVRRHTVDTGRIDSGDALSMLLRALTAEAEALAHDAQGDADALRAAAGIYTATERRVMGP
jgi:hypothetical protein